MNSWLKPIAINSACDSGICSLGHFLPFTRLCASVCICETTKRLFPNQILKFSRPVAQLDQQFGAGCWGGQKAPAAASPSRSPAMRISPAPSGCPSTGAGPLPASRRSDGWSTGMRLMRVVISPPSSSPESLLKSFGNVSDRVDDFPFPQQLGDVRVTPFEEGLRPPTGITARSFWMGDGGTRAN